MNRNGLAPVLTALECMDIGMKLMPLARLDSFLEFCRTLRKGGITLQGWCRGDFTGSEVALVADSVIRPMSDFHMRGEFAHWMRRWDGVLYEVPLSRAEAGFVVAREKWIRLSGWRQDLPHERWPGVKALMECLLVYDAQPLVADVFPGPKSDRARKAAKKLGVSPESLYALLGPAEEPVTATAVGTWE